MNQYVQMIVFGTLPAILLVAYIYWADKLRREPLSWILKGVLLGILSIFVALAFDECVNFVVPCPFPEGTPGFGLWNAFMLAAIPEECAKLLMLWLLVRKNPYFDERMDGIVYAVAVSMGFAGFENVAYLLKNEGTWQITAVARSVLSVPGHYAFAVLMGYYYGLVHFTPERYGRYRWLILAAPVMAHGVFDALLMMGPTLNEFVAVGVFFAFFYFVFRMHKFCARRIKVQVARDQYDQDAKTFAEAMERKEESDRGSEEV